MKALRLVFMGTPAFALPALQELHRGPHRIALVITRPDRPQGRGRRVTAPPVKTAALEMGLTVGQPVSPDDASCWNMLQKAAPDLVVTAAYGGLLPPPVLALPSLGCINLHPSLLPAYRGAAPIQRALMDGSTVTGVTVIRMVPEMDAGEIILQESLPVGSEETAGELHDRLAAAGGLLLARAVAALAAGMATFTPQDPAGVSFAPLLKRSEERLDWRLGRVSLFNRIRGMAPRPGAYTIWRGRRVKVLRAALPATVPESSKRAMARTGAGFCGRGELPGRVMAVTATAITITTGDGPLDLLSLQPAGKRPMEAGAFARGYTIAPGDCFT